MIFIEKHIKIKCLVFVFYFSVKHFSVSILVSVLVQLFPVCVFECVFLFQLYIFSMAKFTVTILAPFPHCTFYDTGFLIICPFLGLVCSTITCFCLLRLWKMQQTQIYMMRSAGNQALSNVFIFSKIDCCHVAVMLSRSLKSVQTSVDKGALGTDM